MNPTFSPSALVALAATANTAAAYIDACDSGAQHVRLDPAYYQNCGVLLNKIFSMLDARQAFPSLLEQSAAAREVAESIQINHRLEVSVLGYYPRLSALLQRAAA
ncbi:MAG: hypothetical protein ACK4FP_08600 [Azonexus sp.]